MNLYDLPNSEILEKARLTDRTLLKKIAERYAEIYSILKSVYDEPETSGSFEELSSEVVYQICMNMSNESLNKFIRTTSRHYLICKNILDKRREDMIEHMDSIPRKYNTFQLMFFFNMDIASDLLLFSKGIVLRETMRLLARYYINNPGCCISDYSLLENLIGKYNMNVSSKININNVTIDDLYLLIDFYDRTGTNNLSKYDKSAKREYDIIEKRVSNDIN